MRSPTDAFQELCGWLRDNDIDPKAVKVTIRIDDVDACDRFIHAWIKGQQDAYARHGHHDPSSVRFPLQGTLYGIGFRITVD